MVQTCHLIDYLPTIYILIVGKDTGDQNVHVARIDREAACHRAIDLDLCLGVLYKKVKTSKATLVGLTDLVLDERECLLSLFLCSLEPLFDPISY